MGTRAIETIVAGLLLATSPLVLAGEKVGMWLCPGDVYTDRPCAGGVRRSIDPSVNLLAAEKRRPSVVAEPSGPSVLMIPRPKPATFEPPPPRHSPLIYWP